MKIKTIGILLLVFAMLTACNDVTPTKEAVTETVMTEDAATEETTEAVIEGLKAINFWPEDESVVKIFTGNGRKLTISTEYSDDNRRQERISDGEKDAQNAVYEKRDGSIVLIGEGPEQYFRQNLLNGLEDPNQNKLKGERIMLMDPIEVGAVWSTGGENVAKIEAIIPATGEHKTRVAVSYRTMNSDGLDIYTYEEGIGVVEIVYDLPGGKETYTMTSDEEDRLPTFVKLYYPSGDGEGLVRKDTKHVFEPNSITRKELEKLLRNVPERAIPLLSENAAINSLYRNQDGNVYIDMNQAFVEEMSVGSSGETLILDALAFTVGGLFRGDAVVITVDNGPYEGGHVVLEKGDTLPAFPEEDQVVEIIAE